jgi:hypothetical protein
MKPAPPVTTAVRPWNVSAILVSVDSTICAPESVQELRSSDPLIHSLHVAGMYLIRNPFHRVSRRNESAAAGSHLVPQLVVREHKAERRLSVRDVTLNDDAHTRVGDFREIASVGRDDWSSSRKRLKQ